MEINMYEKLETIIAKTREPLTKNDFFNAYKALNLKPSAFLEVHSSLSSFGYVINKEYDICDSLVEYFTEGVIIMVAHTGEFSNPAEWVNPPVPKEWIETINKNRKPYDRRLFIPERVGKVAQLFCRYPGVKQTNHPTLALSVLNNTDDQDWYNHDLDMRTSVNPLAKLAKSKGKILFLGTDFDSCTSIHLTEPLSPYSNYKEFHCQRLNENLEIEDVVEKTQFMSEEVDNFAIIKQRYIEKYEKTEYLKKVNLGLGTITLIDAEKLYQLAEDFHINYRK
jgi:aminoglycoside 3-N-acetyltransferase